MSRLFTNIHRVSRLCGVIASLAVVLLMMTITTDVAFRSFFGGSIPGLLEISEIVVVVAVFLGLALAQHSGGHIRVHLVTDRVGSHVARIIRLCGHVVGMGIIAATAVLTWDRAISAYATGEARWGLLSVPTWPGRVAVALGLSVLVAELVASTYNLARNTDSEDEQAAPTV